jgi:hypothetical protein
METTTVDKPSAPASTTPEFSAAANEPPQEIPEIFRNLRVSKKHLKTTRRTWKLKKTVGTAGKVKITKEELTKNAEKENSRKRVWKEKENKNETEKDGRNDTEGENSWQKNQAAGNSESNNLMKEN